VHHPLGLLVEMEGGVSLIFPLGLVLNFDPPDVCSPSSWDYRREPSYPALQFLSCFSDFASVDFIVYKSSSYSKPS
jgi:hypothetical protein